MTKKTQTYCSSYNWLSKATHLSTAMIILMYILTILLSLKKTNRQWAYLFDLCPQYAIHYTVIDTVITRCNEKHTHACNIWSVEVYLYIHDKLGYRTVSTLIHVHVLLASQYEPLASHHPSWPWSVWGPAHVINTDFQTIIWWKTIFNCCFAYAVVHYDSIIVKNHNSRGGAEVWQWTVSAFFAPKGPHSPFCFSFIKRLV